MSPPSDDDQLKHFLEQADQIQSELDRSIFHLRTLYEVSKEIYSHIDSEVIIQNFLLMTMGNYGVIQAFVAIVHIGADQMANLVHRGLDDQTLAYIHENGPAWCRAPALKEGLVFQDLSDVRHRLPSEMAKLFPFEVTENHLGFLGLGPKISGEAFGAKDVELIETLLCNVASALKNAYAFEEIQQLNAELHQKNLQLEKTLEALQVSLRKIEILESVKESLAKFVPTTVTRLIEKFPEEQVFENKRQDITVLFLDIENYTQICKRIGGDEVGQVIEAHFSVFMDAIYANNGDINETAGDGLMVLYLDEDPQTNAMNAARTAMTIRKEALKIIDKCPVLYKPLCINIGINSGPALVGAAKFDSLTGSRWTYTARGQVVNLAARIGAFASGGEICLSKTAAERVKDHFEVRHLGRHGLKNVSEDIDIFAF